MTKSHFRPGFSRRRLLQSLGLGAAMSPLLPILNASGQEALHPKRLLLIFSPDGIAAKDWSTLVDWRPTGTETDFTLHPIQAPLEPYKSKIVVPWGLTMTAGGAGEAHAYGMAGLWSGATLHDPGAGADFDGGNGHRTGWGSAATVDQIVAQAFGPSSPYARSPTDAMQETPYRSVALGVQCGQPTSINRMTYTGDNQPIHPEVSPKAAFDRLFKGISTTGMPTEDPAAAQTRTEQQALLNVLKHDLGRIRTRVGATEYQKIDQHLTGLASIERRIADSTPRVATAGCTVPTAPTTLTSNNANYPGQITQMMDIVAHALACDVTRVATLQMSYGFSNVTHTWLGHTSAHHTMSHDGEDRRSELQAIDTWYATQIAYLVKQLDSVVEGNGTLLDNTLIVWGRELGSTAHRMERVPLMLIGKAAGALKTQRNLNFDKQDHVKLLVSVAQLMGVPITSLGDRKPNSGPLAGLV
jgi:hypothetical protein